MASYQRNPMFGQDSSYDQGWDYDTGWSDYSGDAATPSYTSEPEGTGLTGAQWANVPGPSATHIPGADCPFLINRLAGTPSSWLRDLKAAQHHE